MRRLPTLSAFVSLFLVSACGDYSSRAMLDDAGRMMDDRPEEALGILRSIDTTTLGSSHLRADYSLLTAMALDKNWIDTSDVRVVMPAVHYYSGHKPTVNRARAFYYLGVLQFNGEHYPEACLSMMKAEKCSRKTDDDHLKSLVYSALSAIFSNTALYEEALGFDKLSMECSALINDTLGVEASVYSMARNLGNLGRTHEADSLFRRVILSGKAHPRVLKAALCDHGVLLASKMDDYESAVKRFEEVIDDYGSLPDEVSWSTYAYSLLRVGREDDSEALFEELELMDSEEGLSFKRWKAKAEAYRNDYESAYRWLDLESDIQTDNINKALKQSVVKAQATFYEGEAEEAARMARKERWLVSSVAALLVLLTAGLVFVIRRRSRRLLAERDSLLENYIESCKTNFRYLGRINEMLVTSKEKDSKLYRQLKQFVQNLQDDEPSQLEFERMLNSSFNDVMTHFRDAFPGRRLKFYRFASYLFAGFDATTISILIEDYSKDNVYVEKSRLKSQVKASQSPHKEEFLRLL